MIYRDSFLPLVTFVGKILIYFSKGFPSKSLGGSQTKSGSCLWLTFYSKFHPQSSSNAMSLQKISEQRPSPSQIYTPLSLCSWAKWHNVSDTRPITSHIGLTNIAYWRPSEPAPFSSNSCLPTSCYLPFSQNPSRIFSEQLSNVKGFLEFYACLGNEQGIIFCRWQKSETRSQMRFRSQGSTRLVSKSKSS